MKTVLPPWLLTLTRILLGCTFLFSDHGDASSNELMGFLTFALKNAFPWYRSIVAHLILPHAQTFGAMVVVAEIAVGLALIVGLATRGAAIVAIFLLLNYEAAKGSLPWQPGIDQSDIILALIVLVCAAGRTYGIDAFIHARFPKMSLS